MPVLSNQKMNSYLKEIADVCGIQKNLRTHLARHTCATTVMIGSGMPLHALSKILGHSSVRMTEHYAKVHDDIIAQGMENVKKNFSRKGI